MARGRTPKPTATRERTGVDSKRKRRTEPKPKVLRDNPAPASMSAGAKKWWAKYVPLLSSMGVLTEADQDALADLCNLRSMRDRLQGEFDGLESLMVEGVSYQADEDGNKPKTFKSAPVIKDLLAVQSAIDRAQQQFGLTPSSRTKIDLGDKKSDGPVDKERGKARASLGLAG